MRKNTPERLLEHDTIELDGWDCWQPLHGWRSDQGYSLGWLDGKNVRLHILSFGTVPTGLVLDHLCRHRWCINPTHLEPVTNAENIRRGLLPHLASVRTCEHGSRNPIKNCRPCRRLHRIETGETLSDRGRPQDRTTCPKGHPYDHHNTYLVFREDGTLKQRMCRECGRQRVRARRAAGKR